MYKPLPTSLTIKQSEVNGLGLFSAEDIPIGTHFGMSHLQFGKNTIRTPLGGFINHSEDPNCEKVKLTFTTEDSQPVYNFSKWNLVTIKKIKKGEELTLKYTFYKI